MIGQKYSKKQDTTIIKWVKTRVVNSTKIGSDPNFVQYLWFDSTTSIVIHRYQSKNNSLLLNNNCLLSKILNLVTLFVTFLYFSTEELTSHGMCFDNLLCVQYLPAQQQYHRHPTRYITQLILGTQFFVIFLTSVYLSLCLKQIIVFKSEVGASCTARWTIICCTIGKSIKLASQYNKESQAIFYDTTYHCFELKYFHAETMRRVAEASNCKHIYCSSIDINCTHD